MNIDELLRRLELHCAGALANLEAIAHALALGDGEPYPHELTPAQSGRLLELLGPVGAAGAALLEVDLAATVLRE